MGYLFFLGGGGIISLKMFNLTLSKVKQTLPRFIASQKRNTSSFQSLPFEKSFSFYFTEINSYYKKKTVLSRISLGDHATPSPLFK